MSSNPVCLMSLLKIDIWTQIEDHVRAQREFGHEQTKKKKQPCGHLNFRLPDYTPMTK